MRTRKTRFIERAAALLMAAFMLLVSMPTTVYAVDDEPMTATVAVSVSGVAASDAAVSIGGEATTSKTVTVGDSVTVAIAAENGAYIKSVNGVDQGKSTSYSEEITITGDMVIEAVVTKDCTVDFSTTPASDGGSLTVNGDATGNLNVESGSTVSICAVPAEGYALTQLTVDGVEQSITATGYNASATITANTTIAATFTPCYTVTVTTTGEGTVSATPTLDAAGNVTVLEGASPTVVATPSTGYHVSEVKIDDVVDSSVTGDNDSGYEKTFPSVNEAHTVAITFAPNVYSVTVNDPENGTVTVESTVTYGSDLAINMAPDDGYCLEDIQIDDVTYASSALNPVIKSDTEIDIPSVKADVTLNVTFKEVSTNLEQNTDTGNYTTVYYDSTDTVTTYLNSYTDNGYMIIVLPAGSKAVIAPNSGCFISVNGESRLASYVVTSDTTIEKIATATSQLGTDTVEYTNAKIKFVYDTTAPTVTLTRNNSGSTKYGFYKSDPKVGVSVIDGGSYYSGIKSVTYTIKKGDEAASTPVALYTYLAGEKYQTVSLSDITVDARTYNSDNVVVSVTATDFDDHTTTENITLNINSTKPTVTLSVQNDSATVNADAVDGYYDAGRTVTVTITDRNTTFDAKAATDAISITARDLEGNDVTDCYTISGWKTESIGTHKATIKFNGDANYTWSFGNYTNKADMTADAPTTVDSDHMYAFTVDTTAPTAEISINATNKYSSILNKLTFGFVGDDSVTASVSTCSDATAGVKDGGVLYYEYNTDSAYSEIGKTDAEKTVKALTLAELEELYNEGKFVSTPVTESKESSFVVYARVTDKAGNTKYIGTDGVIIDKTASRITLTADAANANGFHNSDVNISVTVRDDQDSTGASKTTYSGIKKVEYKVYENYDDTKSQDEQTAKESGTLYEDTTVFITGRTLESLAAQKELTNAITLDTDKYDSDSVRVVVTATDNAGKTDSQYVDLKIRAKAPEVSVSFDNNTPANTVGSSHYFTKPEGKTATRTATITVKESDSTFNATNAANAITITAKNSAGEDVDAGSYVVSGWSTDLTNTDIHTATIQFTGDANYTWSFSGYTNDADVTMKDVSTAGVTAPYTFTVDNTAPAATVKSNADSVKTWSKLLEVLTFGLYKNGEVKVSIEAEDATSPLHIEYYKTNAVKAMTKAELDKAYADGKFAPYTQAVTSNINEVVVVYFRITDDAKNYIYVNNDAIIEDITASQITMTPDDANANGIYNKDVNITIKVDEVYGEMDADTQLSGIKTVEYWIIDDAQTLAESQDLTTYYEEKYAEAKAKGDDSNNKVVNLYTPEYSSQNLAYSEIEEKGKQSENTIKVDANKHNTSNVRVFVRAEDNAGNVSYKHVDLDIDATAPTIFISYDNNSDNNGNSYFKENRTATVVITERTNHFDDSAATEMLKSAIRCTDVNGNEVADDAEHTQGYTYSTWTTVEGDVPDAATHTATISFKEGNYVISSTEGQYDLVYTDKAENSNTENGKGKVAIGEGSIAPFDFTVDTTVPTATVTATSKDTEARSETWKSFDAGNRRIIDSTSADFTYGFWSNTRIAISGTSADNTSPIAAVDYYCATYNAAEGDYSDESVWMSYENLDKLSAEKWTSFTNDAASDWYAFDGFEMAANNQFVVYLRVTDMAGNYIYMSTDGLIVDDKAPVEETLAPVITINPQQPVNGIYNSDVKVDITVTDPTTGDTYSGLKNVVYRVYNLGEKTDEGTLYDRLDVVKEDGSAVYAYVDSSGKVTEKVKQNSLLKSMTKDITVIAAKNNSNDVVVEVIATDNAGNVSRKAVSMKIDITAPTISVVYDNNVADSGQYFKADRKATIVVTERNLDTNAVKMTLSNTLGTIPSMTGWVKNAAGGNGDATTWTTTLQYSADGNYEFGISCADLAGNANMGVDFGNSICPTAFTIDKTKPVVTVTYDNNSAQNGNYYNAQRVATIRITERNFDSSRVQVYMTATDDGSAVTVPSVSGWTTEGLDHIARIVYANDAKYTFDILMIDLAGNQADDYPADEFYVDQTAPALEISNIVNQSANSGDVAPVVTYSDTNFDVNNVQIHLVGANRGETAMNRTKSDIHNGEVIAFSNFPVLKENDDIYVLSASVTDKAGNTTEEAVTFSVNRFGSTYALSEATQKIIGQYIKKAQDIQISEINANRLVEIKITLFKNNETIELKEGEDYTIDVEGGNGSWYKYTYTIAASNFEDDGVYRITIHSVDEAGNVSENTLDIKDTDISFGVDKTAPIVNIKNVESDTTYNVESITVLASANDNLKLAKLRAILDDEEIASWEGEDLDAVVSDGGEFSFDISGNSTNAHNLVVIATDAAGNEYTATVERFYVTTDVWTNFYNNKPLFFGTIFGIIACIAVIIFIVL